VTTNGDLVTGIKYPASRRPPQKAPASALAERAARLIERYRQDPDTRFDLPWSSMGRSCRRRCGGRCAQSRAARTRTYGDHRARARRDPRDVGQPAATTAFPSSFPATAWSRPRLGVSGHATSGFMLGPSVGCWRTSAARTRRADAVAAACSTRSATRCGSRTVFRRTPSPLPRRPATAAGARRGDLLKGGRKLDLRFFSPRKKGELEARVAIERHQPLLSVLSRSGWSRR